MKKISSPSSYFIIFIMILGLWYAYILNIIVTNGHVTSAKQQYHEQNTQPIDCACNDKNNDSKGEKEISRISINHERIEKLNDDNSNLNIDLISIGSLFRSEYMKKQKETWASHSTIRSFYGFTELDDDDPYCSVDLDIIEYMDKCKDKSKNVWESGSNSTNLVSNVFRSKHYGMDTMKNKGIKAGWICAQKRPGFAIGRIGRLYKDAIIKERNKQSKRQSKFEDAIYDDEILNSILPNYLIVMDDDTYINMKKFIPYMLKNNKQTQEKAKIYAGCLRGDPTIFEKHQIHWVYPWGGFGLIFNRASIKRLIMPIHCNGENTFTNGKSTTNRYKDYVCSRIKQNLLGEEKLFQDGMSITDLAYAISSRKYFCMHSDHLTSYLIHYYHLSDYNSDNINDVNPVFDFSRIYEYNNNANCALDGVKRCHAKTSHICHRIDAETMETYYLTTNS